METAYLLEQVHPASVWFLKLHLYKDTPLYDDHKTGKFGQLTPMEVLREEHFLLQNLHDLRTGFISMEMNCLRAISHAPGIWIESTRIFMIR